MTLVAECIKLSTTRAPWWSAVVAALLSLSLGAIQPAGAVGNPLSPERAAIGVATFGVPVLMVLAAMTITGEFRTGMIRTTFMATPNRTRVLCAKAVVTAVVAFVFAAVMVVASIALARAVASEQIGARLSFEQAATWRPVGAIALYAALAAVLAVGLGALIRHAAAVISVLLLTPFVIEPLVGSLPRVGERVSPLLPFSNAYTFTEVPWLDFTTWWGPLGALLYFAVFVAAVFVSALVVINRRDP